jgi:hypothetical protein
MACLYATGAEAKLRRDGQRVGEGMPDSWDDVGGSKGE